MHNPIIYFDSQRCPEHAALLASNEPVWRLLNLLADYLKSLPLGQHAGLVEAGAILINPENIYIGPGVVIEPGAYVKGPCYLGSGTVVRHGAYVRGNVITGENCVIGHATEIKNSLLLHKAQAAHFAYVGDSILGNGVNLGAGTRLANLRLDGQEVRVVSSEGSYCSGRRKFGAIIGDDAQLGCNTVCNPGTVMGKRACTHPNITASGVIPADACLRPRQPAQLQLPSGRL